MLKGNISLSAKAALVVFLSLATPFLNALPTPSGFTEITSFSVPQSPSGLFFDVGASSLLYVLCGTRTNSDHSLYVYNTDGEEQCFISIPESSGMSRVDGFYITHDNGRAYIVDSQGPIWADSSPDRLGGSVYQVEWDDPCGCDSGTCTNTSVTWVPTVTQTWILNSIDVDEKEGGGFDESFRNSGIVVRGDGTWYGVNGMHPIDDSYTVAYPKSVVQVNMDSSEVIQSWPFDGNTVGRDVDMEGLTCGPDQCVSSLFIGDEYTYIYELDLESGVVIREWDLRSIAGNPRVDGGVEALTYASSTGYFYAGIQEGATIHVVALTNDEVDPSTITTTPPEEAVTDAVTQIPQGPPTTLSDCSEPSGDFQICTAPTIPLEEKRIRREIRSLSMEEWDKVVNAMWVMKTTSMTDGKASYGEAFKTYDSFVLKHALATTDTRGDQAHFGAHFISWHATFVLEFENALLAVDPTIGAVPYWDECLSEPSAFTEDYFGTDPSGDPFIVSDGKFANWPIVTDFSMDDWTPYFTDPSTVAFAGGGNTSASFLRGADNTVSTSFATRYGSGSGWESSISATCTDDWWACTGGNLYGWNDWEECIEGYFHGGPHGSIGGTSGGGGGGGGGPPPARARSLQGGGGGGGGGGPPNRGPGPAGDFEVSATSSCFFFHYSVIPTVCLLVYYIKIDK